MRDCVLEPRRRVVIARTLPGVVAIVLCVSAHAQEYPTRPIRVVVGPGPDIVARIYGQKLTEALGQQVLVETRPGGGGVVAAETVSKAPPDGYTLLLASASYTINAVLQPGAYDLFRDFSAVAFGASSPFLLVVHPSVPAHGVKDLIALARSKPGQLNYASSGGGTPPHLAGEMFKTMARVNIVHVPYKNAAPALIDTVSGQVHAMFAILPIALPHAQSGRLRALGSTGATRSQLARDIPTLAETALPGFEVIGWNGFLAPAATPRAIVAKLNTELMRSLRQTDAPQKLAQVGYDPAAENTPEQFTAYLRAEVAKWAKLVKEAHVRVD